MGTFVCGVAFLTVPIAAIPGAVAGRHAAAEWLPADVPELQPGVADALAAWSEAGAPSAVLANEIGAAGEGSGFELRAAPESGTMGAGMDVSVDGGGLEWAGDGSRLALFVDVCARLESGAVPSWAFLRVRDADSYAPTDPARLGAVARAPRDRAGRLRPPHLPGSPSGP